VQSVPISVSSNPVHGDVIQLLQYRIYIGSSIMQTSEFRVLGFGIGASSNRIPIVVSLHIMFPEQILCITRSTLRFANFQHSVSYFPLFTMKERLKLT
jgi:hypothetical protein